MGALSQQRKPIFIFILTVVSVVVYGLGVVLATEGVELMLFGLAVSSFIISLIPMLTSKNYFLYEPASFVCLSVLFGLGLKTFYVVLGYHTNVVVYGGLMRNITVPELQYGAMVLLIGLCAFVVGYKVKLPIKRKRSIFARYEFSRKRVLIVSALFILVSVVAFVAFVSTIGFSFSGLESLSQKRFQGEGYTSAGRLQEVSYYYYRLALLAKAPMYVLFFLIVKHNLSFGSRYGFLFFISFCINIIVPFFVSNKAGIVVVVADLFVISYCLRQRFGYFRFLVIAVVSIFVITVVADIRGGGESFSNYSFLDRIFGGRYFVGLTKTAHIVNAFPSQIDYFYGTTLVAWLNLILPDSYSFSSDAFTNLGYFLGTNVFGFERNGIPPGVIAEFYINFGLLGVVVGMFFVGVFLFRLHSNLLPYLSYGCVALIYALVVVRAPTFLFNNGVSVALLKTVSDVVVVVLFLLLVGSFRNRGILEKHGAQL